MLLYYYKALMTKALSIYTLCTVIIITQTILYISMKGVCSKKKILFPSTSSPPLSLSFLSLLFSFPFPKNSIIKPLVGTEQGMHPQEGVQAWHVGPQSL